MLPAMRNTLFGSLRMQTNGKERNLSEQPQMEVIHLHSELNLLIHFSTDGKIEDIEDGGEITD